MGLCIIIQVTSEAIAAQCADLNFTDRIWSYFFVFLFQIADLEKELLALKSTTVDEVDKILSSFHNQVGVFDRICLILVLEL